MFGRAGRPAPRARRSAPGHARRGGRSLTRGAVAPALRSAATTGNERSGARTGDSQRLHIATLRVLCGALVSLGALLAVLAASASATTLRLPSGKLLGYEPLAAADPTPPASGPLEALAASPLDAFAGNVDYGGGPVMPSNTNYIVAWDPSNYAGASYQSGYLAGVAQFFGDLAHDSGLDTNSDSVAAQYDDSSGEVAAYDSAFGGTLADSDPLPAPACSVYSGDACVTDAQVQAELNSYLAAHDLPADLTHEYFLLPPPGVAVCADSSSGVCSANGFQPNAFCAYHAASTTSPSFIYAVIPDMAGFDGCDPYATSCPSARCDYPNSPADGVLTSIEHEHIESITDPEIFTGWNDWSVGSDVEVADICLGASDPDTVDNRQPDGNDAPYNELINGHGYWLQMIWSNQTFSCLDRLAPDGTTASAAFTQAHGAGTTVDFDASASTATGGVAEYEWQFNDDLGPVEPQTTTVETASPTISHAFPATGTYTVALTVMAADGTSAGTAHTIDVQSSVPAVPSNVSPPTVSGTPTAGELLTESHGSWTDDPTAFAYQWEDCDAAGDHCAAVADATSPTYALSSQDVGDTLRVEEWATNGGGTGAPAASAASAIVAAAAAGTDDPLPPPVVAIAPQPPASVAPPTIAGSATQGDTLTERHGSWTNDPTAFGYQWERCDGQGADCASVAGATGSTYTLGAADVGAEIRVIEAASNAAGSGEAAASAATPVVAAVAAAAAAAPGALLLSRQIDAATRSATFRLAATGSATGLRCALVRLGARSGTATSPARYSRCGPAKTFTHLAIGTYTLCVRAVGPGAEVGAVTYTFSIASPRRPPGRRSPDRARAHVR